MTRGRLKDGKNQLDGDALGKFWARNGFSKGKSEFNSNIRMKPRNPSTTIKLKTL